MTELSIIQDFEAIQNISESADILWKFKSNSKLRGIVFVDTSSTCTPVDNAKTKDTNNKINNQKP